MKIFTKVVLSFDGQIVEEDSYEYSGPIAYLKGGSSAPPPPTAAETKLTEEQTALIEQQVIQLTKENALMDELWPDIAKSLKAQINLQNLQIESTAGMIPLQEELAKLGIDFQKVQIEAAKGLVPLQEELVRQGIDLQKLQIESAQDLLPFQKALAEQQVQAQSLQISSMERMLPLQEELAKQGIDLQGIQIEYFKEEISRNKALEPAILQTIGFEKDAEGNYVPTGDIPSQLQDRYSKALSGEEPISPALESELAQQEEELRQGLSQKMGPNWETTTPGIQAMAEFNEKANLVREEARRGMIQTAGGEYRADKALTTGGLLAFAGNPQAPGVSTTTPTGGVGGMPQIPSVGAPTGLPVSGGGAGLMGGRNGAGGPVNMGSLFGGSSASSTMASITGLSEKLKADRMEPWLFQQGQSAGKKASMMGGLVSGATIGTTVMPGIGTAIGAGVGLLAGYLLS